MKSWLMCACFTTAAILAAEQEAAAVDRIPYTIEARFSYQWFESSTLRKIYDHNVDYQLTGTIPCYQGMNFGMRGLNIWWALDYFQTSGRSIGLRQKTNIYIEPITAGLKWICPKWRLRPYFGAALKYYFAQVHANSSYVQKHKAVNGPGFVVETGLQMFCTQHLFLDVFAAYSWVHLDSSSHRPNVIAASLHLSGINAGGGIGVKF